MTFMKLHMSNANLPSATQKIKWPAFKRTRRAGTKYERAVSFSS